MWSFPRGLLHTVTLDIVDIAAGAVLLFGLDQLVEMVVGIEADFRGSGSRLAVPLDRKPEARQIFPLADAVVLFRHSGLAASSSLSTAPCLACPCFFRLYLCFVLHPADHISIAVIGIDGFRSVRGQGGDQAVPAVIDILDQPGLVFLLLLFRDPVSGPVIGIGGLHSSRFLHLAQAVQGIIGIFCLSLCLCLR